MVLAMAEMVVAVAIHAVGHSIAAGIAVDVLSVGKRRVDMSIYYRGIGCG